MRLSALILLYNSHHHPCPACFTFLNWNLGHVVAQTVKNLPGMWETQVQFLGWEDSLEKEMTTDSSNLAWRIPWTEDPGREQSHGAIKSQTRLNKSVCTHANLEMSYSGRCSALVFFICGFPKALKLLLFLILHFEMVPLLQSVVESYFWKKCLIPGAPLLPL